MIREDKVVWVRRVECGFVCVKCEMFVIRFSGGRKVVGDRRVEVWGEV